MLNKMKLLKFSVLLNIPFSIKFRITIFLLNKIILNIMQKKNILLYQIRIFKYFPAFSWRLAMAAGSDVSRHGDVFNTNCF